MGMSGSCGWRSGSLSLLLRLITLDRAAHSPTGVALESAPSQYLGLAGRVVCSGTVLVQPFKWIRMSLISTRQIEHSMKNTKHYDLSICNITQWWVFLFGMSTISEDISQEPKKHMTSYSGMSSWKSFSTHVALQVGWVLGIYRRHDAKNHIFFSSHASASCGPMRIGRQSSCQNVAQSWISIERSYERKTICGCIQCCLSHKDKDRDRKTQTDTCNR